MSDIEDDDDAFSVEYSSEDPSEPDVDLENQYYSAKGIKDDNWSQAIDEFRKVLSLETEKGEWGFRALKQMLKLYFRGGQKNEMMDCYRQLLTYIKSGVTRNYSEKSINSILDHVSTSKQDELLLNIYTTTLDALRDSKNERIWLKTNIKLGKLYLERNDFKELKKILKELKHSCSLDNGRDDPKKGTQLLEIYALEIQMYTLQKNNKMLKKIYESSLSVKSAISHPFIMGIIRECGGKMYLREGEFEKAHQSFSDAFKSYDESGSQRRVQCLKYLVLASMLMKSDINPCDSQETKPYRQDPEIMAMTNLIAAYHNNDINGFEKILRENRQTVMEDPFIREHIEELLRNVRTQILLKLVKPFTTVRIDYLANKLGVEVPELEKLLISLILDEQIDGLIDQAKQVLILKRHRQLCQYTALTQIMEQLPTITNFIEMRF